MSGLCATEAQMSGHGETLCRTPDLAKGRRERPVDGMYLAVTMSMFGLESNRMCVRGGGEGGGSMQLSPFYVVA